MRVTPTALLLAAGLAVGLVACGDEGSSSGAGAPDAATPASTAGDTPDADLRTDADTPPRPKVAIFGVDGATFTVIRPLVAQGRLPHLASLMERGVGVVLRKPSEYNASPVLWTSIMTGVMPDEHGILNFAKRDGGALSVYQSSDRKVPALWSLVDAQGGSAGVVGVWNTWPAEVLSGYVVSDRFPHSFYEQNQEALGAEGTDWGVVYPPELAPELAGYSLDPDAVTREELEFLGEFSDAEWHELLTGDQREGPTVGNGLVSLKFGWQAQESVAGAGLHMLREHEQPDLFAVFLELPDRTSHHFWHAYQPENVKGGAAAVEPQWLERWSEIVPRSYERTDWWIGQMLAELDEDTTVLVVSDHGFQTSRSAGGSLDDLSKIHHSGVHHDDGILIAAGPAIQPGVDQVAHILDVAPLVMLALGLPQSTQFAGERRSPFVSPDFLREHPPGAPVDYAALLDTDGREVDVDPSQMDEAYLEHLRQLGYVDASGNVLADDMDR